MHEYLMHYNFKFNQLIDLVGRVFANAPGDRGSIWGRVIQKTLKMVLDTSWLSRGDIRIQKKVLSWLVTLDKLEYPVHSTISPIANDQRKDMGSCLSIKVLAWSERIQSWLKFEHVFPIPLPCHLEQILEAIPHEKKKQKNNYFSSQKNSKTYKICGILLGKKRTSS